MLKVFHGISFTQQNIPADTSPKSQYHIYNYGRTKSEKGNIDKPHSYFASSNA